MRILVLLTLAFAAVITFPSPGRSGWGGGCGPVGPSMSAPMAPMMPTAMPAYAPHIATYSWRHAESAGCFGLFLDGKQIGWYSSRSGIYRPCEGENFGEATAPPIDPPPCDCCPACHCKNGCHCTPDSKCDPDCSCGNKKPIETVSQNFGLDLNELGKGSGKESYKINGQEVSKAQAVQAIEGSELPDDSNKMRLTVIGSDSDRQAVVNDLKSSPILASIRDTCLIQDYTPDAPMLAGCDFVMTGKPTIYLQKPDGTVLHRQDDYTGGAQALADAVRKADPNYHPDSDPNKTKPDLLPGVDLLQIPLEAWALGLGAVGFLLWRKRHAS
jgi:hypothetical protein